ncbi:MAG: hypothetical protein IPJ37_04120 [Bacteroidales bacterium]|nr:hypothetical protein [Bacteroidales bacterium]
MKQFFIPLLFLFFISLPVLSGQDINYPKFGIETLNAPAPLGLKPGIRLQPLLVMIRTGSRSS